MKEFIMWLCTVRQITLTELTGLLGYKSKTSLVRIQNGLVRPSTLEDFAKRVMTVMKPSEEETKELNRAVERAVRGTEKQAERLEMWNFVTGRYDRENDKDQARFAAVSAIDGKRSDFCGLYADAVSLDIEMINCAFAPVMDAVKELIRCAPERKARQLLMMYPGQGSRTIRMINAVMPVFYLTNYDAYYIEENEENDHLYGNVITVSGKREANGKEAAFCDLFLIKSEGEAVCYPLDAGNGLQTSVFAALQGRMKPLKQTYFSCRNFDNYIQYCADYAALEHDCSIWKIKPDIGLDYIPNDIQAAAMKDSALADAPEFENVMRILWDIQGGRYDNYRTKKQVARTVMKYSAMLSFAKTGRHSDHFWGMRAFTPEERRRILSTLLEVTENNGNYIPNFLRDDSTLRDIEIAYYEGKGFLILRSDTNYDLQAGHCELMLHCEPMEKEYKEFFVNELVPKYCYTKQETAQMIRKLIKVCDMK